VSEFDSELNLLTTFCVSGGCRSQNFRAHMEAMRLRKALSATQKKLDISEKLIDDL
jgi:hypothetical protein